MNMECLRMRIIYRIILHFTKYMICNLEVSTKKFCSQKEEDTWQNISQQQKFKHIQL